MILCFGDSASAQYSGGYYGSTYPTTSNPMQNYSGSKPTTDGVEVSITRYTPVGNPPQYVGNNFSIVNFDAVGMSTYNFAPATPIAGTPNYIYHKLRFFPMSGIGPVTAWVEYPSYYVP